MPVDEVRAWLCRTACSLGIRRALEQPPWPDAPCSDAPVDHLLSRAGGKPVREAPGMGARPDIGATLRRQLLGLPLVKRLAFALHDIEACTTAEVASVMGTGLEMARRLIGEARLELAGRLFASPPPVSRPDLGAEGRSTSA